MRLMVQILFVLAIGIGAGAATAWFSIQRSHGIGAINIGVWTAWPFAGGSQADPYTVARVISDSAVPLGAAEGLAFETVADEDGEPLRVNAERANGGLDPGDVTLVIGSPDVYHPGKIALQELVVVVCNV